MCRWCRAVYLVVAAMAWVPRGPESAANLVVEQKLERAAPNIFKSSRATLQKVLSGGTDRPIVEKTASKGTELAITH